MFEETKPSGPGGVERARALVKAAASGLGGPAGGVMAELLDQVLAPILGGRMEEFVEDLAVRLKACEKDGVTFEDLKRNPIFVDTICRAVAVAAKTRSEEKRRSLRNAVVNTALGRNPQDDWQGIFLGHIERLTPTHIRVLDLIDLSVDARDVRRFYQVIDERYPDLRGDGGLAIHCAEELEKYGLISRRTLTTQSFHDLTLHEIASTGVGKGLLMLISDPDEER